MSTTIAITGAGGFVGSHLAEHLHDRGHTVHVVLRDGAKARRFRADGYRVFRGDVTLPATMHEAITGCRIVVHCAVGGAELVDAREINVQGTLNVLQAAADACVTRVVHVSSVVAHGRHWPPVLTEDAPLVFQGDPYAQTKAEAERAAQAFARKTGLELTIVRPTIVYGPGSGRIALDLDRIRLERVVLIDDGRGLLNMVYVEDLAEALERAATIPGAAGEAFLISGPSPVACRDYYGAIARMCGKPLPRAVPLRRARAEAWLSRWHFRFTRQPPIIEDNDLVQMTQSSAVSTDKARGILGFAPATTLEDGMSRTEAWLRRDGYVTDRVAGEAA